MDGFVNRLLQNHKKNLRNTVFTEWNAVQHQQKINELRWKSLVRGAVSKAAINQLETKRMYAEDLAVKKSCIRLDANRRDSKTTHSGQIGKNTTRIENRRA